MKNVTVTSVSDLRTKLGLYFVLRYVCMTVIIYWLQLLVKNFNNKKKGSQCHFSVSFFSASENITHVDITLPMKMNQVFHSKVEIQGIVRHMFGWMFIFIFNA